MRRILVPVVILSICVLSVILLSGCKKSADNTNTDNTNTNTGGTQPVTVTTSVFYRKLNNDSFANELWSVNSDGTSNQKIAITLPAGTTFDNDDVAKVSSDKKTIVFLAENQAGSQIFKCNIDGSGVSAVTPAAVAGVGAIEGFIGTSAIVYWKQTDVTFELWRINIDGSNNQKINITLPANTIFDDAEFAKITSDGSTLVFSVLDHTTFAASIYKCNIDGSNMVLVSNIGPNFSMQSLANDNMVLYQIYNTTNSATELWAVNLDGTNKHQITLALPNGTSLMGEEEVAQVSKSGTLFFATNTNDANEIDAIYSANLDGSNIKLLTQIPGGYNALIQQVAP